MNEATIIDHVYSSYEGDVDDWTSSDDEYLAARRYGNQAIKMWENYDNTQWRELYKSLSDAGSDVTKTVTAGTYNYTTSSDFRFPVSYVRTVNSGTSKYYSVFPPEEIPAGDDDTSDWCYFTGNPSAGYKLNFNPELTLTTGDELRYEYYKTANELSASSSTPEMTNPMFIVHYVLWRMYKNDGEDGKAREEFQIAQQLLEQMKVDNMAGVWNQPYNIEANCEFGDGFGI